MFKTRERDMGENMAEGKISQDWERRLLGSQSDIFSGKIKRKRPQVKRQKLRSS